LNILLALGIMAASRRNRRCFNSLIAFSGKVDPVRTKKTRQTKTRRLIPVQSEPKKAPVCVETRENRLRTSGLTLMRPNGPNSPLRWRPQRDVIG
jgi:hypothetical protein